MWWKKRKKVDGACRKSSSIGNNNEASASAANPESAAKKDVDRDEQSLGGFSYDDVDDIVEDNAINSDLDLLSGDETAVADNQDHGKNMLETKLSYYDTNDDRNTIVTNSTDCPSEDDEESSEVLIEVSHEDFVKELKKKGDNNMNLLKYCNPLSPRSSLLNASSYGMSTKKNHDDLQSLIENDIKVLSRIYTNNNAYSAELPKSKKKSAIVRTSSTIRNNDECDINSVSSDSSDEDDCTDMILSSIERDIKILNRKMINSYITSSGSDDSGRSSNESNCRGGASSISFSARRDGRASGSSFSARLDGNRRSSLRSSLTNSPSEFSSSVHFGSVEIHEHKLDMGGSVPSNGPCVSLGWERTSYQKHDSIDDHKRLSGSQRVRRRSSVSSSEALLRRTPQERFDILLQNGHTMREIRSSVRESAKDRKHRIKSLNEHSSPAPGSLNFSKMFTRKKKTTNTKTQA